MTHGDVKSKLKIDAGAAQKVNRPESQGSRSAPISSPPLIVKDDSQAGIKPQNADISPILLFKPVNTLPFVSEPSELADTFMCVQNRKS